MKLKFKEIKKLLENGLDIKIETLNGFEKPLHSFTKKSTEYEIVFDNEIIKCADTHLFLDKNNEWIMAKDLKEGMIVKGKGKNHIIKKVTKLQEQEFLDFEMPHHHYIVNDIINHNSGKSITQSIIATYLWYKKGIKSVIIVPNVSLVEQFYNDFLDYFKNSPFDIEKDLHKIYAGKPKHFEKPITITTWQSLAKDSHLFEDIGCVIVDEVQKTKDYKSILTSILLPSTINSKYKFGFTGSIPLNTEEKLSVISSFGKIYTIVKAKDLIQLGYGTPIHINLIYLKYPIEVCKQVRKMKYQQEKDFFEKHEKRNKFITDLARTVTDKYGNTLILYHKIEHGKKLLNNFIEGEFIPKLTSRTKLDKNKKYLVNFIPNELKEKFNNVIELEKHNIFFIYGEVEPEIRERIRKITEEKNNVIIIANFQTFATGINIKNLHNLIFATFIKSFITIVQSLGRVIRLHQNKQKVRVFDIIDDCRYKKFENYAYKHFLERLAIYNYEEHLISEKEIKMT